MVSNPAAASIVLAQKMRGFFWNDDAARWLAPHQQSNMAKHAAFR
jgi:hypothetical protein